MVDLFRLFFRVAFLASPPQDVPAGERTFVVGVTAALLTYVGALALDFGVGYASVRAVVDLGLSGAMWWACLRLLGREARFQQSFGAYCGAVSFANLAALVVFQGGMAGTSTFALADFVLLVWNLALLGFVIRHTLEVRMWVSIVSALVYVYVLAGLMFVLLPMPPASIAG